MLKMTFLRKRVGGKHVSAKYDISLLEKTFSNYGYSSLTLKGLVIINLTPIKRQNIDREIVLNNKNILIAEFLRL